MTTSSQVVAIAETLREIPLTQLEPSSRNPRRTVNPADIKELAASIREHGIQVPLIVRPDLVHAEYAANDHESHFEIVAGHRRYEAARLEKLAKLPCIVRDLTDEEAAEIALVDNLQRVDVPAMEEAAAFGELLERLGSIPAIAAKVGKEQAYVAKRLKLRTLTLCSQDALREKLITIDHAMLLARLGEDEQNAALKWCLDHTAGVKKPVEDVLAERLGRLKSDADDPDDGEDDEDGETVARRRSAWGNRAWEPQTVQRLKEHIECESGTPLDRAPWPMEEDYLALDAGSCLDCPKNTKANVPLFGDLDIGVAVCTDGGCFKEKTQSFVNIQLKAAAVSRANELTAQAASPKHVWTPGDVQVLRVSWKSTSTAPRQLKDGGGVNPAQTFKDGQWEEATKKCEFTRPAVTVDWMEADRYSKEKLRKPGEIVQACIQPKCKVHPKSYEKTTPANGSGRPGNANSEANRKARDEREAAFAKSEPPIRRAIYDAIIAKLKPIDMHRLVLVDGNESPAILLGLGEPIADWKKAVGKVEGLIKSASAEQLVAMTFHSRFGGNLDVHDWDSDSAGKGRDDLLRLAKSAGIDAAAIVRKFDAPVKSKPEAKPAPPAKKAVVSPEAKKRIAAGLKKSAKPPAKQPAKKVAAKKKAGRK